MISEKEIYNWLDAWNSHVIERILDLFVGDAVVYQPQNPLPLNKQKLSAFFSLLFETYPDIHFKTEGFIIQGNEAASWETVTGTMSNAFHDPATGNIVEATGNFFKIDGAMRIIYDDEKRIKSVRIYWDRLSLNQQLGLTQ